MILNAGHSMSELLVASSAADTPGQGMSVTAGALLRDAREAAGLHIAALAVALKVPVAKLEALEADNFSALPDMVFVRALASSVCRTLKIDPQAVLALLPQGEGPRLSAGDVGLNAPVKGFAGRSSAAPFKGAGSRSFVWAVGLLLIGAALMMFLPRGLDADLSALLKQPETTTKIPMPTGNVAQEISVAVGAEQRVPSAAPAPAAAAAAAVGVGVELPAGESIKPAGIASHPIVLRSVEASAPSSAPAAAIALNGESMPHPSSVRLVCCCFRPALPRELFDLGGPAAWSLLRWRFSRARGIDPRQHVVLVPTEATAVG